MIPKLDITDYEILGQLSTTIAGPVNHIRHKESNTEALMFCVQTDSPTLFSDVLRILKLDDKKGILDIHGISDKNDDLNLPIAVITEYPIHGCLSSIFENVSFADSDSILNKLQISCLLFNCANAFRILHSNMIFFDFFNHSCIYLGDKYECKIANPGVKAFFDPSIYNSDKSSDLIYLAPEILRNNTQNEENYFFDATDDSNEQNSQSSAHSNNGSSQCNNNYNSNYNNNNSIFNSNEKSESNKKKENNGFENSDNNNLLQSASIFTDVYAFGSLLYQCYVKDVRFPKQYAEKTFIENIIDKNRPALFPRMPPLVKSTITQCWQDNPYDRPTFSDILRSMIRNPEFFFNLSNAKDFVEFQHSILPDHIFLSLKTLTPNFLYGTRDGNSSHSHFRHRNHHYSKNHVSLGHDQSFSDFSSQDNFTNVQVTHNHRSGSGRLSSHMSSGNLNSPISPSREKPPLPVPSSSNLSSKKGFKLQKPSEFDTSSSKQMYRSASENKMKSKYSNITISPCINKKGRAYASNIIHLQSYLINLNRSNFEDSKKQIFKNYVYESVYTLISHVMTISQSRFTLIDLYADILSYLYRHRHEETNLYGEIPDTFLKLLREALIYGETFPKDIPKVALFSWCLKRNIFTDVEVVKFIREFYKSFHENRKKTLTVLFAWFAPQVQENDERLYRKLYKILEEIQSFPNINYAFTKFHKNFEIYQLDNWKKLRGRVMDLPSGGRDIGFLLRHDDISNLKIFTKEQPRIFAKRVLPDIYSACVHVHDKPTIIMYAAAYQAVNCFQYLQLKGASLTGKDEKYRTLSDFAIIGGNLTIVRFIQNSSDSFNSALQTSTLVHNNFLFQYLIKWKEFNLEEPDKFDRKVITTAASANNIFILLYCINEGIQLDTHETFGIFYF